MALIQNTTHSLSGLFADAENSLFCARCAVGASQKGICEAQNVHGPKAFWASFKQDLSFWRSLMRFLFTVRTEEQIRQLLDRLNRCSCRMSDPKILAYHRGGRLMESELLKRTCVDVQTPSIAFITQLFIYLEAALDGTHLKAVAKRIAENWPTCPEDIMPFGPESLIDSFIMWSRFIPDTMVFRVAAQCIRFCGSLLIPYAIESALTQHVIDAGRQLFDRTWAVIRLRAETRSMQKAMGGAFMSQIEMFLGYFDLFYVEQSYENKMKIMDGNELKAVQIFSLLCYVADDPRLFLQSPEIHRNRLEQLGLHIYSCMEQYLEPLPSIPLYPSICALNDTLLKVNNMQIEANEMFSLSPELDQALTIFGQGDGSLTHTRGSINFLYTQMAEMAIDHIRIARYDLYCSARNCSNSIQSTGRQFQRCGRCNVAVYCSKMCQIAAWSAEQYPHRRICKILQSLVEKARSDLLFRCLHPAETDPEGLSALVIENWKQAKVPESDFLQITGWGSYKTYPLVLPTRAEHAPGFADYEEKLTELTRRKGALQAQYPTVSDKSSTRELYDKMRIMFDKYPDDGQWVTNEVVAGETSNDLSFFRLTL